MSALAFQVEKMSAVIDEAWPLLQQHWQEIAIDKADTPLDPDWETYGKLEQAGLYHCATARSDGALVGYSSYVILPRNLHYAHSVAESDIFYLRPDHRQGLAGARLLKFAEQSLAERGISRIATKTKLSPEHDLGPLLDHLGYRAIERVYVKRI